MKKTFEVYPKIKKDYDELLNYARQHREHLQSLGRNYDFAVLSNFEGVDFTDKVICDLGSRNSHFGPYLTKIAKQVHVSDYFKDWNTGKVDGLPDFKTASEQWKAISPHPERLICEEQDIVNLTYKDDVFDYVICTSVIEHLYPQAKGQGDTVGIKEMVRILKPGGILLLSSDMSKTGDLEPTRWVSGTYWYTEKELFDRVIIPSGCELVGNYDFSFENSDNDCMHPEPKHKKGLVTSCIFALKKPKSN